MHGNSKLNIIVGTVCLCYKVSHFRVFVHCCILYIVIIMEVCIKSFTKNLESYWFGNSETHIVGTALFLLNHIYLESLSANFKYNII